MLAAATAANFGQFGARVGISPFVFVVSGTFVVSKSDVGIALTLMWAAFAIMQFPSGVLADRYGTRLGLVGPFLTTAGGFGVLLVAPTVEVVYVGVCVVGSGLTWAGPIQSRFMSCFPADERASGFGMARGVFVLFGSVGNVATGTLADLLGSPVAALVVAALVVAAALAVVAEAVGGDQGADR